MKPLAPRPLPTDPKLRSAKAMRVVLVVFVLLLPVRLLAAPDFTKRGPYAVGYTSETFTKTSVTTGDPRPLKTLIWYPAEPGTGRATGDVLTDADVKRGRWPVVLFSHGLCGIPNQSVFLTTTLASWGFVVAAPPHPGGELTDGFPGCVGTLQDSFKNRVADIQFVIDQLLAINQQAGSRFAKHLNPKRIGMSGHSFGGQTTMRVAAADKRVRAALALAPALYGPSVVDLNVTIPTMIMTGDMDSLAPFDADAVPYYAECHGPRFLVKVLNTGHYAFSDICAAAVFGGGHDCDPGTLTQDQAHALVLQEGVPFLLRYVAGRRSVSGLLKPTKAPAGAPIVEHALRKSK